MPSSRRGTRSQLLYYFMALGVLRGRWSNIRPDGTCSDWVRPLAWWLRHPVQRAVVWSQSDTADGRQFANDVRSAALPCISSSTLVTAGVMLASAASSSERRRKSLQRLSALHRGVEGADDQAGLLQLENALARPMSSSSPFMVIVMQPKTLRFFGMMASFAMAVLTLVRSWTADGAVLELPVEATHQCC